MNERYHTASSSTLGCLFVAASRNTIIQRHSFLLVEDKANNYVEDLQNPPSHSHLQKLVKAHNCIEHYNAFSIIDYWWI